MRALIAFLFLPLLGVTALSQNPAQCPAPPASLSPTAPDIFNEKQEQDLGDAYAEIAELHARFLDDPAGEEYLRKLGQRLLAVLPPSNLNFRYKIVDTEEINAYSIAGGHIYFTRKLIAASRSEDEIAGVLAHEIGHILTHQQAIDATAEMAQLLHVTSVGDREDIFDKVHRMNEMEINGKWHAHGEDKEEDAADTVALYATMKAGYPPRAYVDFWDRVSATGGKTGSALGDFFHTTRPAQKRLRTMMAAAAAIPSGCASAQVSTPSAFVEWQRGVIASVVSVAQTATDTKTVKLDPPLRSNLRRVRFSPDGKYILAQDDSTIFVLTHSPLKSLFQIDAVDADYAWFTPDSSKIVFSTSSLHVEEWDIAAKQRSAVHEIVLYGGCLDHLLSPDGHSLACITDNPATWRLGLTILDVPSGETRWKKDGALIATDQRADFVAVYFEKSLHQSAASWSYTPDSTKLLLNLGSWTYLYDTATHTMQKLSGIVDKLDRGPFAFVGNDRLGVVRWENPKNSGLYSFPDGKLLNHFAMGDQALESVTNGDYLLLRPMKDAAVGVLDLKTYNLAFTLKNEAVDIYQKSILTEAGDGLAISSVDSANAEKDITTYPLPVSLLGNLQSAILSPDGKFLAVSSTTRSAIWNAETGERLLYVRPFKRGYFGPRNLFYSDFPKYRGQPRALGAIDLNTKKAFLLPYDPPENAKMAGDLLLEYKTQNNTDPSAKTDLEVRDLASNAVLWTRHFPHAAPECSAMLRGNEMVFTWGLESDGAREELKERPELKPFADALPKKETGLSDRSGG